MNWKEVQYLVYLNRGVGGEKEENSGGVNRIWKRKGKSKRERRMRVREDRRGVTRGEMEGGYKVGVEGTRKRGME